MMTLYPTKDVMKLEKTCLATQNIRGVALSRYECAEMQDRFSVFIQVWILSEVRESIVIKEPIILFGKITLFYVSWVINI